MGLLDKILDKEKISKVTIKNPREVFNEILKQASGSSYSRELKFNIFYQTIAFRGIVDGIGTSTLVANTAIALAQVGLTVCVIDTSILRPVQDVLLQTEESVNTPNDGKEHLTWFDMPYTKKSPLHISKINKNVSVLSFKGKENGNLVDFLSTNDSNALVDMALTELHNKFDLILIDCCLEPSEISTACLQMSQHVIQVWNDSPTVLANLENHLSDCITLSCPMDKMRFAVCSKMCKHVIGSLDEVLKQYHVKQLAISYESEELSILSRTGKLFYQYASSDETIIDYTNCIIDIVCHILNIESDNAPKGTITSQDIMDGKVEGTYHKKLKDFNDKFAEEAGVVVDRNPMNADLSAYVHDDSVETSDATQSSDNEDELQGSIEGEKKKKGLFSK